MGRSGREKHPPSKQKQRLVDDIAMRICPSCRSGVVNYGECTTCGWIAPPGHRLYWPNNNE